MRKRRPSGDWDRPIRLATASREVVFTQRTAKVKADSLKSSALR
jgi:hypothetical protein